MDLAFAVILIPSSLLFLSLSLAYLHLSFLQRVPPGPWHHGDQQLHLDHDDDDKEGGGCISHGPSASPTASRNMDTKMKPSYKNISPVGLPQPASRWVRLQFGMAHGHHSQEDSVVVVASSAGEEAGMRGGQLSPKRPRLRGHHQKQHLAISASVATC